MTQCLVILLLLAGAWMPSAPAPSLLTRYRFAVPAWRTTLPKAAVEASGLALYHGHLLVHGDESATITVLDPANGTHQGMWHFGAGRRDEPGDFEAIGVHGDDIVLLRSDGDLFIGRPDTTGRMAPLLHHRTSLGGACEFEAMIASSRSSEVLLICKEMYHSDRRGDKDVYRVSLDNNAPAALAFTLSGKAMRKVAGTDGFTPSDAALIPETGHLLILASHQHAIIEVDAAGTPVAGAVLSHDLHPQAEGLALLPDGMLLIADEAQRDRAHLAAYAPLPLR